MLAGAERKALTVREGAVIDKRDMATGGKFMSMNFEFSDLLSLLVRPS
jgi:hypothetical protein